MVAYVYSISDKNFLLIHSILALRSVFIVSGIEISSQSTPLSFIPFLFSFYPRVSSNLD